MEKIEKRILIRAPINTIMSFVNEPTNLARIASGMIEVSDVIHLKNGGRRFQCLATMVGSHVQCGVDCTEYVANRRLTYNISGGIRGSIRWLFQSQNDDTEVALYIEYDVPHPLLKRHSESTISQRNEHGIQLLLCNLKAEVESQTHRETEVKHAAPHISST